MYELEVLATALADFRVEDAQVVADLGHWGYHYRLLVKSADGRQFFLRERPPYLSAQRFAATIACQHAISCRGYAARPFTTSSGELTTDIGGRQFALIDFVALAADDRPIPWLAKALWNLHRAIDAMPTGSFQHLLQDLPEHAPEPAEVLAYSDSALAGQGVAGLEPSTLRRLRSLIDAAAIDLSGRELVHGDANGCNVRIAGGSPLWIDFDNTHLGARGWELAKLAAYRAVDDVIQGGCPPADCYYSDLAAGYSEVPWGTRAAMPLAMLVLWIGREDLDDETVPRDDRAGLDYRARRLSDVLDGLLLRTAAR